jgi:hypothetical protein
MHRIAALTCFLCLLALGEAGAQDLEPRQYSNIPIGLNFLVAGYGASEGGVLFDPAIALDNASIRTDGPAVGYARSLALGALSGKLDAGIAKVCLAGSADYQGQRVRRDVCGWTDARMRLSVNFLGAPARRLEEFAGYQQKLIVGASLLVSAPTGQYDAERLVNIGSNRVAVKAEIGMSKARGKWLFELALAGTYYETNNDFLGGETLQQDSIASFQAHVVRNFASGVWVAVDSNHYQGGRTRVNGIAGDNWQSNARFGATVSIPINRRQSVKVNYSTGVSTRTGSDFDALGVGWQYRWGRGL